MKKSLIVVSLLAGLGAVAFFLMPRPAGDPAAPEARAPVAREPSPAAPGPEARREGAGPAPRQAPEAPAREAPAPAPAQRVHRERPEAEAPLEGLEVRSISDVDRERMKVPKTYGDGVLITQVHPASPAAEVGLAPGDVIVRAQRTNVSSESDLRTAVLDRDHVLVAFYRDGELLQAVLKRPHDAP